jgi:hypothetical protein
MYVCMQACGDGCGGDDGNIINKGKSKVIPVL